MTWGDDGREWPSGHLTSALAYVDKCIDNAADLDADLTWTNVEVVEMFEDIRSLLLTGAIVPGAWVNVEIRSPEHG